MKNKSYLRGNLLGILILGNCLVLSGQTDSIYIDPSANTNGTGTQASPWNGSTLSNNPWKPNTAYLFKRGTTYSHSNKIDVQVAGVILGAYGTGAKPIILQTANSDNIIGAGSITVQDLELIAPSGSGGQDANQLAFWPGTGYLNVINCKIHGGFQGVRVYLSPTLDVKVTNCEIYDMWSDGMFIYSAHSLEVGYCNIYNVNTSHPNYPDDGDNIHTDDINTIYIHHNTLDHTTQPGKFCLLLGSAITGFTTNAIVEYNTMKRTRTGTDNTVYYSNYAHGSKIIFRYNKVQDALVGLQSRTYDMQIYYNCFINVGEFMELNAPTDYVSNPKIWNNTIYNSDQVIYGYGENVDFKNNIIHTITGTAFTGGSNLSLDYNDYYNIPTFGGVAKGAHDIAQDPLFNNLSGSDLTLKSNSPCIDKGINVLNLVTDLLGINVPTTSVDMGAYQYSSGTGNINPNPPSGEISVCPGSVKTYTTSGTTQGTSYTWQVTPTNAGTITGNGLSVSITWSPTFSGSANISYVATGPNNYTATSPALLVAVNTLPVSSYSLTDVTGCNGQSITITQSGSESGVKYQLQVASTGVNVGSSVNGVNGPISYTVTPSVTQSYKVVATNNSTTCTSTLTKQPTLTVNPLPTGTYSVNDPNTTSGKTVIVTQSGSQTNVNYQLQVASTSVNIGSPVLGTGSSIQFSVNPTTSTTYKIIATNTTTRCATTLTDQANVTISGSINNIFALSDPVICSGENAIVKQSGSEIGISYQLQNNSSGANVGSAVAGTGNAIQFVVTPTSNITYKVLATSVSTAATTILTDLSSVTINPLPTNNYSVSDPTTSSGKTAIIAQSGSQTNVNYQLQIASSGTNIGNPVAGAGSSIQFAVNPTASTTYKITATNTTSGCSSSLTDLATVTISKINNTYTLSDPTICKGSYATIKQSGSEVGIAYQLQNNSSGANIGSIVAGTGAAIQFVITPASNTTYKVLATNATSGATSTLTDLSSVTVNQIPASPEMPSGTTTIAIPATNTYNYSVNPLPNAESYTWSLSPSDAGTITGNINSATVSWNNNYTGNAFIMVMASNLCGTSSTLQALQITMTKSSFRTDVPTLISGNELWDPEFLSKYPQAEISIFDINGRLISKFKGSDNGSNFSRNQSAITGTYLYVIDLKDGSAPLKGKFVLIQQ